MRAFLDAGPVTVHENVPEVAVEFGTAAAMTAHVVPLSRLTSMRTDWVAPRLCVQLMLWTDPIDQLTFVFGAVTAMVNATLKSTSLIS
jgi:hypothetical protein